MVVVPLPGVLTGCVSRPAGSVTERETATLVMTRLPSSVVETLSPSVETSSPAPLASVFFTGE